MFLWSYSGVSWWAKISFHYLVCIFLLFFILIYNLAIPLTTLCDTPPCLDTPTETTDLDFTYPLHYFLAKILKVEMSGYRHRTSMGFQWSNFKYYRINTHTHSFSRICTQETCGVGSNPPTAQAIPPFLNMDDIRNAEFIRAYKAQCRSYELTDGRSRLDWHACALSRRRPGIYTPEVHNAAINNVHDAALAAMLTNLSPTTEWGVKLRAAGEVEEEEERLDKEKGRGRKREMMKDYNL